ncbi:putative ribonuclease H-like domain-containing protein [Tanacetum coccineum]|uniref:Ribonuclease H-like domain-containing protein n=1 Tax=Tanacetum coccineum TaxID=301880 RepID=A0ABQ4YRA6_9ASTR
MNTLCTNPNGQLTITKEDNRRRDGWNPENKDGSRTGKKEESKALVTVDGESVDWTTHSEDDENYAFMASNSSGSDTQVTSCSNECKESYANLKRLYDAQREQLSDASVEIKAYTQGLKKVEAQLVAHQQGQLWYEQKIKFMKIDLDDKTDVLTYHKKLLAKAQKEKDDLEVIVDKWNHSSKNLGKIVNYHMSASDKFGLGYGDYRYSGILSYENEVLQSVFKSNKSDFENPPLHKRLVKTCEMQAVPPPMTGNYLPSRPDIEIDDSQYTYGPRKSQPSESESQTTELDTCDSNISTEPSELVSEPVVNESNVEVQPKVWSDAPIIEEYESDSDDEYVSVQTEELDTPSFANKQVKTPRENVKIQSTHSQRPKGNNKELGQGFTERACFVCGSFSHLIRDCDYHVKLAKQVELNKQNMSKGNGTGERKPTWNNVQRVNKQNQFVPLAVQTRTGNNPVNTAKASSTNNFSTARQNVNRQTVLTSTALKVNTVKPIVNGVRPANVFHKTHSPSSRPFKRTTVLRTNFSNQKVYTAKVKEVSTVGGKWDTADNPHRTLKNKGIIDSGCSRHMTGNKAYLADFQDFNGGPVAFGGSKGYITGKGKIKTEVQPKVWSDAPIIEEYESDSDDEYVSVQTKGLDTPSFANKQVKTPRENVKNQSTHSQKPKVNNKELGHGFTERACFVCGSFSHLIRDCDYHVKLAKQVELNKQNMSKGNGTRERKPTWNNVQRVNKQNQFVPLAVQTRTGNNPVNTAKASGTNNISTARQKVNRQTVLTSTALKVNTVKPIVNGVRPANVFHKTHSPSTRPFKRTTVLKTNFSNQKVYTAKVKQVSTVGVKWDTAVKASAGCDNPHRTLKNKGIIDSGCSRHMTGNKAYLADFQDFNGGPVAFGGSKGYITGKGKIKTGKLDFEDVSFVKELQPFNLFSVSQMCDKKNKVLFTDSECLVLSPDFKLPDENQILLKVPRQNNMYSFNLENIVPLGGKQHKASCKAKAVSSISQTLQLLHMDLFGPTSVRSLNHKTYCLVITDDFSRFSWVFFLRTKDETSAILKDFIRQIENQLNQKVKTIRSDNGTEFKNKEVIEFCGIKGIKREYSNARTPQQNGVAERKNRTLIEAARTMLADSFLPNTFWAEAVSTACYVLNRVLVTKPHNKTPYELLTGKGPTWLFDLDYLTNSMNYHPVSSENQANLHAGQQTASYAIWPSYSSTNTPAVTTDDKRAGPREEEQVFMDDLERLKNQEKEANEEAEVLRKKFETLVIKEGAAKPSSTNIFSTVSTPAKASSTNPLNTASIPVSTASPYEGLSLADPTHSEEDDSEIPPLEDIYQNSTDGIFTTSSFDDDSQFPNCNIVYIPMYSMTKTHS